MNPLAASLLAQTDSAKLGAGAVSLVVLFLMAAGTALLVWNMNGRLKRLPSSFAESDDTKATNVAAPPPPAAPEGGAASDRSHGTA
jgi:hypothetical protein